MPCLRTLTLPFVGFVRSMLAPGHGQPLAEFMTGEPSQSPRRSRNCVTAG
jgi:hypothetical protein